MESPCGDPVPSFCGGESSGSMVSPYLLVLLRNYAAIQASVVRAWQCPCRFIMLLGLQCLLVSPSEFVPVLSKTAGGLLSFALALSYCFSCW